MTIEQKILEKLRPHAERIKAGQNNEFDYLPAVLLHLIEAQKAQTTLSADQTTDLCKNFERLQASFTQRLEAAGQSITNNLKEEISQANQDVEDRHEELITLLTEQSQTLENKLDSLESSVAVLKVTNQRLLIMNLIATVIAIGLGFRLLMGA